MEQEKKNKYDFRRGDDGRYEFILKTDEFERIEKVSLDSVKKHYKELQEQKINTQNMLNQSIKQLESISIRKDEELERFIELADKAAQYKRMLDMEKNKENALKMLEGINESIRLIEKVLPELKRMKK